MADNRRQQGVPWVGMRRVELGADRRLRRRADRRAVGVSNRLPTVRAIPLATALSLTEAGVPAVVRTTAPPRPSGDDVSRGFLTCRPRGGALYLGLPKI